MPKLLFQIYLAKGAGKSLLYLSSVPSFDRAFLLGRGYLSFDPVALPLPLGAASRVFHEFHKKLNRRKGISGDLLSVGNIRDRCRLLLCRLGLSDVYASAGDQSVSDDFLFPESGEMQEIEMLLKGRLLSVQEVLRFCGSACGEDLVTRALQILCLEERVVLLPALYPVQGSLVHCQRCGWEGIAEPHFCARCGGASCCSCPECGLLGNLSFCDQLYTAAGPLPAAAGIAHGWLRRLLEGDSMGRRQEISCSPLLWIAAEDGLYRACGGEAAVAENSRSGKGEPRQPDQAGCRLSDRRMGASGSGCSLGARYESLLGEIRLTPSQEKAAAILLKFGREEKQGEKCLVWAACGAGKTEVSFPLIAETLRSGGQVLFTTPRRDVVLEIAPRMGKAFGEDNVCALYGGSGSRQMREVPLVVATTHQALRFYRKFDLVILDEGDAYPYPGSRMLHFAVQRARSSMGKLVYLTATPASWMFTGTRREWVITIPVRPHGFPLPLPKFLKVNPFKTSGKGIIIAERVLEITAELLKKPGARLFIFVPSVSLTSQVGERLRRAAGKPPLDGLHSEGIEWIHAGDRERIRKRERFFAGEFPVLVTTTIMERGVTAPRVQVLVLEAGQEGVFDAPTLVQIAGRCGRSPDHPTGDVWFISSGVSRSMREARAQITGFNREARRKGYLRENLD